MYTWFKCLCLHTWLRDSQDCIEAQLLYSVLFKIISKLKLICIFSLCTWPFYSSIAEICEIVKGTGIPCFIVLYCTLQMLHFFINWRFMATLSWASLSAPFSNSVCLLCVSVSHLGNSNFKVFHHYYICYGDLCSVIMTYWKLKWWLAFFSSIFKLRYMYWFFLDTMLLPTS